MLRIVCPDADFLYEVTKVGKKYWGWLKPWFEDRGLKWDNIMPVDCLVQEIATARLKGYGNLQNKDYSNEFLRMERNEFFDYITEGLSFDIAHIGDHINYWTFEKVRDMLSRVGFKNIIRSKYAGSVMPNMRNIIYFDKTHPEMSLFIEAIK